MLFNDQFPKIIVDICSTSDHLHHISYMRTLVTSVHRKRIERPSHISDGLQFMLPAIMK